MNRITHFEFGVTDIVGWKIESWGGYPNFRYISTGDASEPGINGAMLVHQECRR